MIEIPWIIVGLLIGVLIGVISHESRAWRALLTAYLQQRVKKPFDLSQVQRIVPMTSESTLSLPKDLQAEIDLQEQLEREEQLRELRDG